MVEKLSLYLTHDQISSATAAPPWLPTKIAIFQLIPHGLGTIHVLLVNLLLMIYSFEPLLRSDHLWAIWIKGLIGVLASSPPPHDYCPARSYYSFSGFKMSIEIVHTATGWRRSPVYWYSLPLPSSLICFPHTYALITPARLGKVPVSIAPELT